MSIKPEVGEALVEVVETQAAAIHKLVSELLLYESAEDIAAHVPELSSSEEQRNTLGI